MSKEGQLVNSPAAQAASAELFARFEPIFARIQHDTVLREREHRLPYAPVQWLREAGFGALRIPVEHGGFGASLPQLLQLLVALAAADSNLAQILRAHFGFVETLLSPEHAALRERWYPRLVSGELIGAAMAERTAGTETTVRLIDDASGGWRLNGSKFYCTGTLFADWIAVVAAHGDEHIAVAVASDAAGVTRVDDWDGFGQQLSASGTTHFEQVSVSADAVIWRHHPSQPRPETYLSGFYQTVHLATLAGISKAILRDAIDFVSARTRVFGLPGATSPRHDPLVQRVVGRLASIAFASATLVDGSAQALESVQQLHRLGHAAPADYVAADLKAYQAQQVVLPLVLEAANALFEVGGASALAKQRGLDRHWRNARTLASHNPAILRERALGDYYLNDVRPREPWFAGAVTPQGEPWPAAPADQAEVRSASGPYRAGKGP